MMKSKGIAAIREKRQSELEHFIQELESIADLPLEERSAKLAELKNKQELESEFQMMLQRQVKLIGSVYADGIEEKLAREVLRPLVSGKINLAEAGRAILKYKALASMAREQLTFSDFNEAQIDKLLSLFMEGGEEEIPSVDISSGWLEEKGEKNNE